MGTFRVEWPHPWGWVREGPRRNLLASGLKRRVGAEVRRRWAYKVVTWIEHLRRYPDSIGCQFLGIQDDNWLRSQRLRVGMFGASRTLDAGETRTRSGAGYPIRFCANWLDKLSENEGLCNPERSKSVSRANADALFELIFARKKGPLLSVMDR